MSAVLTQSALEAKHQEILASLQTRWERDIAFEQQQSDTNATGVPSIALAHQNAEQLESNLLTLQV